MGHILSRTTRSRQVLHPAIRTGWLARGRIAEGETESLARIIREDSVLTHNRPHERCSRSGGFRPGATAPCPSTLLGTVSPSNGSRLTRANPERRPAFVRAGVEARRAHYSRFVNDAG